MALVWFFESLEMLTLTSHSFGGPLVTAIIADKSPLVFSIDNESNQLHHTPRKLKHIVRFTLNTSRVGV